MPLRLEENVTIEAHERRSKVWGAVGAASAVILTTNLATKGAIKVCEMFNLPVNLNRNYYSPEELIQAMLFQPSGLLFTTTNVIEGALAFGIGYFASKAIYKWVNYLPQRLGNRKDSL